jgi:predicted NBD/HSP70 family sugar kinase
MRKATPFEILRLVRTSGPLSRTDLAEMTEVALSHISVLTREALNKGFLIERGSVPSASGRRRILLEANPEFAKLVGVDIGRDHTRIVVTDFASRVLAYKWLPTEPFKGKDHLLQVVHDGVKSQLGQFPNVAAIGISHSGVVDPQAGKVLFWPMVAGWDNTPLRQIFETAHGLPAYLVGDGVRAMAVTEERFGHGKGLRNFVLVSVGMGIGCAIFCDGHLYVGRDGLAGELGHTTVAENGELCSCGNRGCLELSASAAAIVRRVRSELERGVTSSLTNDVGGNLEQLSVEAIVAAAKAQDRLAERVLSEVGTHLGTALASMVNLLNPEKVILAGKVPQAAGEILMGPLRFSLRHRALPQVVKDLAVVVSQFGEEAAAVGTTLVAGEEVLKVSCRELEAA